MVSRSTPLTDNFAWIARADPPRRRRVATRAFRVARVVDEADAQAFRHDLVDCVAKLRRVVASKAAAIGDLADQHPPQLLR